MAVGYPFVAIGNYNWLPFTIGQLSTDASWLELHYTQGIGTMQHNLAQNHYYTEA